MKRVQRTSRSLSGCMLLCFTLCIAACGSQEDPQVQNALSEGPDQDSGEQVAQQDKGICLNYNVYNPDAEILSITPVSASDTPQWDVGIRVWDGSSGYTTNVRVNCSTTGTSAGVEFSCSAC